MKICVTSSIRETFARLEVGCAAYDTARNHRRTKEIIEEWGDGLRLLGP